jgi:NADPH-dependent 2,4-dienoyl-CoA reductase/sulfur reductase-like enzyme
MVAAITARQHGLTVMVVDDQPTPGGQIWRSVEATSARDDILGPSYVEGRAVAEKFRDCGAIYEPGTQVWQIEPGFRVFVSRDGYAQLIEAKTLILATGAQERPVPFPGWTLPGVFTVGAAQILLKNAGQIPAGPVWIAGCGPLPLLYTVQLLRAGGHVAGYLDTTPTGQWTAAVPHFWGALRASAELIKGLGWSLQLRLGSTPVISGVTNIEAFGQDRIEQLRYRSRSGNVTTVEASTLLVHEGVIPNIHSALSLDLKVAWSSAQDCLAPVLDSWGESSLTDVFVAGDGAGIGGAKAAKLRGELAALRVAVKLGRTNEKAVDGSAREIRRKLGRELAVRPFLDAMFKPRAEIYAPSDETVVCRCEEVTACQIRTAAKVGLPGPNQLKAATRAGMGPCQGRQCGYTVARLIGEVQNRSPSEVGFYHIRPPLKPVTLGELASLDRQENRHPENELQE